MAAKLDDAKRRFNERVKPIDEDDYGAWFRYDWGKTVQIDGYMTIAQLRLVADAMEEYLASQEPNTVR